MDPLIIDGIECYCLSQSDECDDYPEIGLENLYQSEKWHFWFLSRREYILEIFKKYIDIHEDIIEVGAGTGSISHYLMQAGYKPAVGELYLSGLRYAKSYGIEKCYQFDINNPPFKNRFDVIGVFDVLEHLTNDIEILKNINSMLRSDGKIILTVPAHMWLWCREDQISGHKTRYTASKLKRKLKQSGFKVIEAKYFFSFITPLLWLRTILHHDDGSDALKNELEAPIKLNPIVNRMLLGLCRLENRTRQLLPNKFGGSLMIVAQKTKTEF